MSRAAFLLLVLGLTGAGACDPGPGGRPVMLEDTVPAGTVVGSLDTTRTYEYRFVQVDPDSLLTALWNAGVPVTQAWLPLDNRCADPRGPVFTVELWKPDPAILAFDFLLGTGRLACATQLRRYRVQ